MQGGYNRFAGRPGQAANERRCDRKYAGRICVFGETVLCFVKTRLKGAPSWTKGVGSARHVYNIYIYVYIHMQTDFEQVFQRLRLRVSLNDQFNICFQNMQTFEETDLITWRSLSLSLDLNASFVVNVEERRATAVVTLQQKRVPTPRSYSSNSDCRRWPGNTLPRACSEDSPLATVRVLCGTVKKASAKSRTKPFNRHFKLSVK